MSINNCIKCNSANLYMSMKGTHVGLYCSDCGAWQKWLTTEEIRAMEQRLSEIELTNTKKIYSDNLNESLKLSE